MSKIITFTPNPALDLSTAVDHLVAEEKLRCDEPLREPGGGGINVSRALKKLGSGSKAIYTAGGVTGDLFSKLLKDEDIGCCPFKIKGNTRESFSVLDRGDNNLYRFVTPGGELSEDEWKSLLDLVSENSEADFIVASGSLPPGAPDDYFARLSRKAKENEIKLILDTSGEALAKILDEGAYLIKPNKTELGHLVERELKGMEEIKKAAQEIINLYEVEVLVVSMGGDGALLVSRDTTEHLKAPQVEKKSAVGAGDSMVAGMVKKLAEGEDIRTAAMFGLACGSAAIMTPGSELLRREDAESLFEKMRG